MKVFTRVQLGLNEKLQIAGNHGITMKAHGTYS